MKEVAIKIYSGKNLLHNDQNYVNGVKTFLKLKRKLHQCIEVILVTSALDDRASGKFESTY